MKYPITPDYLESVPDPLVGLYTDLEEKILKDICRRFKLSGEATESAIAQMKILQERGVSLDDIEKFVRETLNLSEKELDKIIDRAVDRNRQYYDRLIEKADILNAEFRGLDREIAAIRRQTHDELFNLTQSMGFAIRTGREVEFLPVAKTYQKVLDDAAAQVLSGAVDYNTAIREAVKRLTDSGLQTIDYASGWHNRVDVAVRRAVMTGVSQLSSQYAEQAAEELETDLREVTAHVGARDIGTGWQNHKNWQGKVYSVKAGDKYPSIYEVCGWGMVDGLEGANCRHHHYPFLEGVSERTYTDEQLENIDPPPFEYQGKTYSAYEATQKQRQIERAMRKSKREIIGYEAAGQTEDAQDSAIRLRRLSQEYKAFSKEAGLRTQPERSRVDGFGRERGKKVASPITKSKKEVEKTQSFGIIQMGEGDMSVDVTIDQFTPCLLDSRTGKIVDTRYELAGTKELKDLKRKGWLFNWTHKSLKTNEIYKLTTIDSDEIQGLVAIEEHKRDKAYHLSLAESAPHNKGDGKLYEGVGGHLFAIAVKRSLDAGYGGFIFFEAKNMELVKHYEEKFGALLLGRPHEYSMIIDEDAAKKLLSSYTLE